MLSWGIHLLRLSPVLSRYAGVLTEEEVTRITRDKLIKLQSLYIEQFKWLQYVLKERRRKYLHDRRKELQLATSQSTDEEEDGGGELAIFSIVCNLFWKRV